MAMPVVATMELGCATPTKFDVDAIARALCAEVRACAAGTVFVFVFCFAMRRARAVQGFDCGVSLSAGRFLCNYIYCVSLALCGADPSQVRWLAYCRCRSAYPAVALTRCVCSCACFGTAGHAARVMHHN